MYPSLFLSLFLLWFCMPGDTHNEDESPEHSHTTTASGECDCPDYYAGIIISPSGKTEILYIEGAGFWTIIVTKTHGVPEPECRVNCGSDVSSEDEHLTYCYYCDRPYWSCQEYHDGTSQCGNIKY